MMPTGYRSYSGVDLEDLFEPGTTQVTGYRLSNGINLQFAARGTAAKGPDVGYRDSSGTDLSNYWLPKGSLPPPLGFDGKSYISTAQAPSGASGSTTARLLLTIQGDGQWVIQRSNAGSGGSNGTVTLESGTWLPGGQAASDYEVQFEGAISGGATVSNSAATYQDATIGRTFSLTAQVTSASGDSVSGLAGVICRLRRKSSGVVATSHCSFSCMAAGWY